MANHRKLPPDAEVRRALDKDNITYAQAAERWGVSVETVKRWASLNGYRRARNYTQARLPWTVGMEWRTAFELAMLRLDAKVREGIALPERDAAKLAAWKGAMEDARVVVDFDRSTGFRYIPRRPRERGPYRQPA